MTRNDDGSVNWHGLKIMPGLNVGTVLSVLGILLVQTIVGAWVVSGSISSFTATNMAAADRTRSDILDLKARVDKVEVAQVKSVESYSDIKEQLGTLKGQSESILAMLRDLQADRRMRTGGPPSP